MFGTSNKYIPHKSPPQSPPLNPPSTPHPSLLHSSSQSNPYLPYIVLYYPSIVLQSSSIVHSSSSYRPTPSPLFLIILFPPIYTPILPYISPKTHTTFKLYLSPKRVFVIKCLQLPIDKYLKVTYNKLIKGGW